MSMWFCAYKVNPNIGFICYRSTINGSDREIYNIPNSKFCKVYSNQ